MCVSSAPFYLWGFPGFSVGKESACSARDMGLIPRSGTSSSEENGYPCRYSCLENPMEKAAWQATVYGVETLAAVILLLIMMMMMM